MRSSTRRQFLTGAGAALALGTTGAVRAAMGPNDKFDLVIKGGVVIDPSQGLKAKRDIGIRYGLIEAIEAEIAASRADKIMPASGKRRAARPSLHGAIHRQVTKAVPGAGTALASQAFASA